jgi:lipoic acid synthetase
LIRTKAKYETSLNVLKYISGKGIRTKSGFMTGLGENDDEVKETIYDLFSSGCRILTVGQYLQPTMNHMNTVSFISPEKFGEYREMAYVAGFEIVECNPLVRSSFHAEKHIMVG